MKKCLYVLLFLSVTSSFAADQGSDNQIPLLEAMYGELPDLERQQRDGVRSLAQAVDDSCPICMEDNMGQAIPGNGRVHLSCGHEVCSQCYIRAVVGRMSYFIEADAVVPAGSYTCPLCRAEFPVPAEAIAQLRRAVAAREGLHAPNNRLSECAKLGAIAVCSVLGLWIASGNPWGR